MNSEECKQLEYLLGKLGSGLKHQFCIMISPLDGIYIAIYHPHKEGDERSGQVKKEFHNATLEKCIEDFEKWDKRKSPQPAYNS